MKVFLPFLHHYHFSPVLHQKQKISVKKNGVKWRKKDRPKFLVKYVKFQVHWWCQTRIQLQMSILRLINFLKFWTGLTSTLKKFKLKESKMLFEKKLSNLQKILLLKKSTNSTKSVRNFKLFFKITIFFSKFSIF